MMPLSMVRPELTVRIVEIRGGRGLIGRLAYMDLYPGVEIEVIANRPGSLIVDRGGTHFGLGMGWPAGYWDPQFHSPSFRNTSWSETVLFKTLNEGEK